MGFLLDTNIVSELRKSRPNPHVQAWYDQAPAESLYLSVLVIGEIRQGIEWLQRRDESQAVALDGWLTTLKQAYGDRIIPVTIEIAEEWGRLGVPDPLPYVDGLLAATARIRGWTLVTRNIKHVERTGVALVNPFESVEPPEMPKTAET